MQKIDSVVAVSGAGSMGGAIASGLVASGAADASRVLVSDPSAEKRAELEKSSIRTFADTADMLAENPDVVILAVKPQILSGVPTEAAIGKEDWYIVNLYNSAGIPARPGTIRA